MSDPQVSVIIAAYNGARLITETIASLTAQTLRDFEIVVVDDASTDDTLAVLRSIPEPRLRIVAAPANGGPAVARTIALEHARGRYIAGLDQDDLCRPDRLARQVAFLDTHRDTVLVASAAEPFGEGGLPAVASHAGLTDPDTIDWRLSWCNPLVWSSVMIRGDAARALDPFERDAVRFAEDFDLYHRIRSFGRIARIDAPLIRYRHHAGGVSKHTRDRMIAAAGEVLAIRYADAMGDTAPRAGALMSRHAAARLPVPDAETLGEVSGMLAVIVQVFGPLAPSVAPSEADRLWWQIARSGLRHGRYGITDLKRARRIFTRSSLGNVHPAVLRDAAIGWARRRWQQPG
ncbi:glycosyltransferase family A protein [uncultured Sphingomonas sp.]|jgi:glycosyltransferase involved in cell wall biosynthesis|uniref:glycosyltransferase family 2 protein n=1 Tax=uncultured Sphingomonas sp. TaxID=158754 RepID=UPI0030D83992